MGVASDSGAVIRVEMMDGSEQEFYFDPDGYVAYGFTDPFSRLFGCDDVDVVYDALASFVYNKDDSPHEFRQQLEDYIREEIEIASTDEIRSVYVKVDRGYDDFRSVDVSFIDFEKYRGWRDVARLRLSNWYLLDQNARDAALGGYAPVGGFGEGLADALAALPPEGADEAELEVPIDGVDGVASVREALDAIDALSALVPELEISGTLEVVGFEEGAAVAEGCTTIWSMSGMAGVGYKTVSKTHGGMWIRNVSDFRFKMGFGATSKRDIGVTGSFMGSLAEATASASLPAVLGTAGRRIRKGVELAPGDALLLEADIDGRRTEFPKPGAGRGAAKGANPFAVSVKTLKGKGQGQLVGDDMLMRVIALNIGRAVAFVETVEPLTVRVDLIPDAAAPTERAVCDTAFKFVQRNVKKSPKRFTKLTGYLRKYPERKQG